MNVTPTLKVISKTIEVAIGTVCKQILGYIYIYIYVLFFLKIFISFLKQCFTIFTKTQLYNNKITIATTTRSSFLELFLEAGGPQK